MNLRIAKKIAKRFYNQPPYCPRACRWRPCRCPTARYTDRQQRRALVVVERAIVRQVGIRRRTLEQFIADVAAAENVAEYLRAAVYAGWPT